MNSVPQGFDEQRPGGILVISEQFLSKSDNFIIIVIINIVYFLETHILGLCFVF